MSDNYVHCAMLFELILSLLLQSKETFCHLLVKCCRLLLVVICRSTKRTPLCNNVKFPVFSHFSYNSLHFERSDEISVFRRLHLCSSSSWFYCVQEQKPCCEDPNKTVIELLIFIFPDFSKKIFFPGLSLTFLDHSNSLTFSSFPWPVGTLFCWEIYMESKVTYLVQCNIH